MARLIVMRHAKALAGTLGQADADRELDDRGVRDATAATVILGSLAWPEPVMVLVSPAVRTQHTYRIIRDALPVHNRCDAAQLYEAHVSTITALLDGLTPKPSTCVVIGHNPSLRDLVTHLTGEPLAHFPTAAIAVLEGSWGSLASGTWTLAGFDIPRAEVSSRPDPRLPRA